MAVVFKAFEQIEIDGQSAGNIVDVISNHAPRRAEVLAAFGIYTAALVSAHKTELDAANAKIAELEAKVAALDAIKSFNPRHLASTDVFLARFTQKETKEFYASTDPVLVGGQAKFELYEKEGYYIDLDDPDVQGLTAYMVQLGKIDSMERRAEILRDATAAEAYYATV